MCHLNYTTFHSKETCDIVWCKLDVQISPGVPENAGWNDTNKIKSKNLIEFKMVD